ncbi:MAG: efflux RND transporter permease subunit, partial [Myxococcota bacterium]|nr:efflux RND transporter permease subunit [Myxococcota bacterium]
MRSVFRFFAERHTFATLLLVMVLILGGYTLLNTNRSVYPRVDLGELIIHTLYPGAAPEDVELNVTNKIEDAIRGVSGLKRVTSSSMENISSIHIVLDEDVADPDETIEQVRDAVSRVTNFPSEVTETPQIIELKTAEMPIIEVAVVGDVPYPELRSVAKSLEKKLRNVSGIAKLRRFGLREREVRVALDPDKLNQHQIPLREIVMAIEARNIRAAGGTFESYTSERNLVTLAQFEDPMQVRDVIVRSTFEGPRLRIKDLAEIEDGYEPPSIESRLNGRRAISFLVKKSEGADIIRTVDAIEDLLAEERATLPETLQSTSAADYSRLVRNRFDVVQSNGLIGLGLVAIVLWTFLNFQTAIWVALGIPFCLLGMIFSLKTLNYDLDVISLAGFIIVLGIIVDDAIIVSENIFRRYELGDSPVEAAVNGLDEVFRPVLTTLLTTLCAFSPMFFMSGIMGKFIFVIPLVVSLALLASLIEVTAALPAHLVPGLAKRDAKGQSKKLASSWFEPIRRIAHKLVVLALRTRYIMVLVCFSFIFGSLWYAKNHMDFVLFPASSAEEFHIMAELPGGSSLAATSDSMKVFEQLIGELPKEEIDSFVTRIGRWGVEFPVDGEQYGTVQVILTPFSERERTADEIVEVLREKSKSIEGFENILYHVKAGGPPVGAPIEIRVVNSNDADRLRLTDAVFEYVQSIPGAVDLDRDDRQGKQQVQIHLDYDKLSSLGLTVADVAQNVRIAFDGQAVTNIRYGDEDVEFRVVLEERARRDNQYLLKLLT